MTNRESNKEAELNAWFNALPCEGIGKEHYDALMAILRTSPQQETEGREIADYLVWSNQHHAWWRAASQGYSRSILGAGLYTRGEALAIARTARDGWKVDRAPDEIAVALADIPEEMRAALTAALRAERP